MNEIAVARSGDARKVLALCWIAYALAYVSRSNMAVSLSHIVDEGGLRVADVSMLGTLFFVSYAVGQLVNGRIGDLAPPRAMISLGLLVSAASNAVFGAARAYPVLAAAWTLNGVALSALWGPMTRLMAHFFDDRRRNFVSMVMMTSAATGCALSWGFSDFVIGRFGYRALFTATGAAMLPYGLLFLALLPRAEVRGAREGRALRRRGIRAEGAGFLAILLVCAVMGFIKEGINFYAPYMLDRSSGGTFSASFAVALPVFSFLGSVVSALLNRRAGIGIARLIGTLFGLSLAALAVLFAVGSAGRGAAPLILTLLGVTSAMMYAATTYLLGFYPMRYDVVNAVSYVAGLLDFCAYIGAGMSSIASGLLFDAFGLEGVLLLWLLLAVCVALASLAVGARRRRVEKT